MNPCQNCGKLNSPDTNFCRFCGSKFIAVQPQPAVGEPFDHAAPRPYAWKTDEFQTQNEARKTRGTGIVQPDTRHFDGPTQAFRPAPLAHQQPQQFGMPFRCPHCASQMIPNVERRISTAGWITFAVLLVFFFPLFWIGLLIKEDVPVCQTCRSRLPVGPHR
jgi:DNA-directed RNA polymerase subunit RPC12/RpoP